MTRKRATRLKALSRQKKSSGKEWRVEGIEHFTVRQRLPRLVGPLKPSFLERPFLDLPVYQH